VVATAPSESDDVLPWALENTVILELASALKLTRPLEACVETVVESVIFSISLCLNKTKSTTVKLSSEQPKSTWKI